MAGGASMVIAFVDTSREAGNRSSPDSVAATSASVAPHESVNQRVAGGTMTRPATSRTTAPASTSAIHVTTDKSTEPIASPPPAGCRDHDTR